MANGPRRFLPSYLTAPLPYDSGAIRIGAPLFTDSNVIVARYDDHGVYVASLCDGCAIAVIEYIPTGTEYEDWPRRLTCGVRK